MHDLAESVGGVFRRAGVMASMVVGLVWLLGYPIGVPGGLLGGPDGWQAWFAPGSAEPVSSVVEIARR